MSKKLIFEDDNNPMIAFVTRDLTALLQRGPTRISHIVRVSALQIVACFSLSASAAIYTPICLFPCMYVSSLLSNHGKGVHMNDHNDHYLDSVSEYNNQSD